MTASTSAHGRLDVRRTGRIRRRAASFITSGLIVAAVLPVGAARAFADVAVSLQLRGAYGSVSIRVNGSTIGTCSVSNCLYTVPVGSSVRLTPDGDITSWGPGPCQNVFGTKPCDFTALSNTGFQVVFLG
ncbi:hypothetical protein [Microbispora triticiradicis]|uniref:hypothetical protein n=1 Tax=Microbispora triticiradicis TaxID=2200763 RepID=UPI001AD6E31C|nr:hypothetical protein [Microbispora triticiradicis]MBO4271285.1 hypothetical protein [Microbispora triticiradicis]